MWNLLPRMNHNFNECICLLILWRNRHCTQTSHETVEGTLIEICDSPGVNVDTKGEYLWVNLRLICARMGLRDLQTTTSEKSIQFLIIANGECRAHVSNEVSHFSKSHWRCQLNQMESSIEKLRSRVIFYLVYQPHYNLKFWLFASIFNVISSKQKQTNYWQCL